MTPRLIARTTLAFLFVLAGVVRTGSVRAQGVDVGTEAQREAGKQLYLKYCAQCHGENGDGEGYAAPHLYPKPRNFTTGKFKIRSTPNGALPTHQDLVDIIRRGMPYTSMPGWPNLTNDQQISNIAYYLTTFSPDFSNPEFAAPPVPLPDGPRTTDETIALGKKLYEEAGCIKCHGTLGRGDGPSAPTLKDDWGYPIRPADLSQRWTFRGGGSRAEIFKTMSTGLNGTPMPSFRDALQPDQLWAITDFITSLGSDEPDYTNLVIAKHVTEPIDLEKGAANFASAPAARFPIIGQIMEPGRSFHPPATNVLVQAIYDADSIAFLVRWHDMSAQRTGTNGPSLPVPPEEEEGPSAEDAGSTGSVFGDAEVSSDQAAAPQDPFADAVVGAEPAEESSEFSDAVAIQIPSEPPAGPRKPYFIFGDSQSSVDLWFFDLATQNPVQFTGRGSADVTARDTTDLTGVANYQDGEWSVIFKRPRQVETGAPFTPGEFLPIAFSVWDGFSRERGNRRGLTVWYSVYVEPEHVPSAIGPMVRTALLILVIELAIVGWVRWRYGSHAGKHAGGQPTEPAATSV